MWCSISIYFQDKTFVSLPPPPPPPFFLGCTHTHTSFSARLICKEFELFRLSLYKLMTNMIGLTQGGQLQALG